MHVHEGEGTARDRHDPKFDKREGSPAFGYDPSSTFCRVGPASITANLWTGVSS